MLQDTVTDVPSRPCTTDVSASPLPQRASAPAGRGLIVAGLLVWVAAMGLSTTLRDLWHPDEPRYAEVAREMVARGDWALPHRNGRVYAHKPPLMFWLIAAASKVSGGFSRFAVRLPSFAAGLALLGLTYAIGRQAFGHLTGVLSAIVLAATYHLVWFLPRLNLDTLFAYGVAGTIWFFYLGYTRQAERRWAYPLAYLALAVSLMTKGPAALPMVATALVALVACRRDWRELPRFLSPLGIALLLLVWGGWLALAARSGGVEYLRAMFVDHQLSMAIQSHVHRRPIYYYVVRLPLAFFPWVAFLPAAVAAHWRGARFRMLNREAFLIATSASLFALMSLSSAKRINYLTSLLPFLSVLVAAHWAHAWTHHALSRGSRAAAWGLVAVFASAGALAPLLVMHPKSVGLGYLLPASAALLGVAFGLAVALRRARPRWAFTAIVAGVLGLGAYANCAVLPAMDSWKSLRPFARQLRAAAEQYPDAEFATYRFSHPSAINFYSGLILRPIRDAETARGFWQSAAPRFCVLKERFLPELYRTRSSDMQVLFRGSKGRDHMVCAGQLPVSRPPCREHARHSM